VACLIFPPLVLLILVRNRHSKSSCLGELFGLKALLYDMFEEPYRVTSQVEGGTKTMFWWTAWRLYERLAMAMIVTFLTQPLLRMCVVAPVIVCLLLFHYYAHPYKEHMTLLSWLDVSSFACLTFYVVESMFRAFLSTFDIPVKYPVNTAFDILGALEIILTPLTGLALFIVISACLYLYRYIEKTPKSSSQ